MTNSRPHCQRDSLRNVIRGVRPLQSPGGPRSRSRPGRCADQDWLPAPAFGLTVIDRELPSFALKVTKKGAQSFIVRVVDRLGGNTIVLGKADKVTAEQAREKDARANWCSGTDTTSNPNDQRFGQREMVRIPRAGNELRYGTNLKSDRLLG